MDPGLSGHPEPKDSTYRPPRYAVFYGGGRRQSVERAADATPWITYILLAINLFLFIAMWITGGGDVASVARAFGDKEDTLIRAGQIWRLVTPIFLHGSISHLLVNSMSLYWLGSQLELLYGARKFLIIYLFAGVCGNLLSFFWSPAPSLGASGAIFGLVGAGLVFPIRFRKLLPEQLRTRIFSQLLTVTLINLAIGFMPNSGVDNMAHMGGWAGGGFVAFLLIPHALDRRPDSVVREAGLWTAAILLTAMAFCAGFAQWRWTVRNPMALALTYQLGQTEVWGTIAVPRNWKLTPDKSVWYTPEGAEIALQDSDNTPGLKADSEMLMRLPDVKKQSLRSSGRAVFRLTLSGRDQITERYLISDYDRLIAITLTCRPTIYPRLHTVLGQVVNSLQLFSVSPRAR